MPESSAQEVVFSAASPSRWAVVGVALVLGLATAVADYRLECRWDALQVFQQFNVLFDADPNTRLTSICHGWGNRSLIHPHFSNIFSLPIRFIAKIAKVTHLTSDEMAFRHSLGLGVIPAVSGLAVSVLFLVFLRRGFSVPRSGAIAPWRPSPSAQERVPREGVKELLLKKLRPPATQRQTAQQLTPLTTAGRRRR